MTYIYEPESVIFIRNTMLVLYNNFTDICVYKTDNSFADYRFGLKRINHSFKFSFQFYYTTILT